MGGDPKITMTVYILGALVLAGVIVAVIMTNVRLRARKRATELLGRPPVSTQEGIAVAMEDRDEQERKHRG
jgi:hypothetical protein